MMNFAAAFALVAIVSAVPALAAPAGSVNASDANVFVSPSPIDASRDSINNSSMPGTQNGAWVNNNTGGLVSEGSHQPLVATNVAAVATPIALFDSFGAVVNSENLTAALPHSAGVQSSVPRDAALVNSSAQQTQLVIVPPSSAQVNNRSVRDTQVVLGTPVASSAAVADSSSAFVQTNIRNQQFNQSFATGNGPIVAILPAGSNLSATWDLNSNQRPTVGFALADQSTTLATVALVPVAPVVPVVPVVAVSESTSTATTTTTTALPVVASSSVANAANMPVILPVGVADQSALGSRSPSGVAPVLVPVGSAGSNTVAQVHGDTGAPVVQQNHRFEIQLIDLQMNNSANSDWTQNIVVSVKVTAGVITPSAAIAQNLTLANALNVNAPVMAAPETTSGVQQVFNGTYKTSVDNKVSVQRTITQDLCGQISDKAFLTVVIAPLSGADAATFPQQSYTCVVNLNFPTAARSTESFWSDILQCNSGVVNGFSYRLWYKVRQYNIDWANCQQNRPDPVSVA